MTKPEAIWDVLAALRNYQQADADGVMVLVSRQACDEAADALATAEARIAQYREALRKVAAVNDNGYTHCKVCGCNWHTKDGEHHAPDCLLATKETT